MAEQRIEAEARDWLVRLGSGRARAEDLQGFQAWRQQSAEHARIFEQERAFLQDLGRLAGPPEVAERPLLTRRRMLGAGLAVTAVAAGAVIGPDLLLRMQADHLTATGEQAVVDLPDGSRLWLDTGTAIALEAEPGRRGIRLLAGEALLRVAPAADDFALRAGESLSLTRAGEFALRFEAGEARLISAGAEMRVFSPAGTPTPLVLRPEQQVQWREGAAPGLPSAVDPATALAWREGRIVLDGMPFATAARELARYLPERLVLRGRAERMDAVNGTFATSDARDALEAVAMTQGLTVRRIPGLALLVS